MSKDATLKHAEPW